MINLAPDFNFPVITSAEVEQILLKLDQFKVSNPDSIPAIFYKRLSSSLSMPLTLLFNKSLLASKNPTAWKESYLTPVFKSGSKCKAQNYRPISILCAVSKVFERVVFNKEYAHFSHHIVNDQHGFVKGRSTNTNLLEYVNSLVKFISNGGQVDTLYTSCLMVNYYRS